MEHQVCHFDVESECSTGGEVGAEVVSSAEDGDTWQERVSDIGFCRIEVGEFGPAAVGDAEDDSLEYAFAAVRGEESGRARCDGARFVSGRLGVRLG